MKLFRILSSLACLFFLPAHAHSQSDPIISKVADLKSAQAVVFVSDCQSNELKYVMIFRVGETVGDYAQVELGSRGPATMNFGEVTTENGKWKIAGSTGGAISGRAQYSAMNYLMKMPFHLLQADQLDSIYKTPSDRPCNF